MSDEKTYSYEEYVRTFCPGRWCDTCKATREVPGFDGWKPGNRPCPDCTPDTTRVVILPRPGV